MRHNSVFAGIAAGIAVASCATVSGLADYGVVDCPGGCADVDAGDTGAGPGPDSGGDVSVDTGPPACDPTTDAECMQLPAGWTFVGRAPLADGGSAPACPMGLGSPKSVFESPAARSNTCTCDACNVTTPANCSGKVSDFFGAAGACTTNAGTNEYTNTVAGQCYTDLYTGARNAYHRFVLPSPGGGACQASAPVVHDDRFDVTARAIVCDDVSRCSGGVCDARLAAPFAVCVAQPGVVASCPAGFPDRHVVGETATADCASTCTCSLNRAACAGNVNHYTDANCANGVVAAAGNNVCTDFFGGGTFLSYKVVATSATTCTAGGTSNASNARVDDPRTVCCR